MKECSAININKIFLMLGGACNFHCRYCLQTGMENSVGQEPTEEVYQYLERLIKIRPCYQKKLAMIFWGGEPLIYFDVIKKVVERLGDKLNYGLVTNGALLTQEIVDYANEHNLGITVSHDGANTVKTRNKDVLADENIVELLKQLKRLSVESVTSAYNYDYAALFAYIKEKLGDVPIAVDRLHLTWDMPEDIYDIPLAEYEEKLRWLAGAALQDMIALRDTQVASLFGQHVENIIKNRALQLPICNAFYGVMNIDCVGNVYPCHNTGERIGHISEERVNLAIKYDNWLKAHTDEACSNCPIYGLCGGSCPLTHGRREKLCGVHKVFYGVCIDLANAFLNSFEPVEWEV